MPPKRLSARTRATKKAEEEKDDTEPEICRPDAFNSGEYIEIGVDDLNAQDIESPPDSEAASISGAENVRGKRMNPPKDSLSRKTRLQLRKVYLLSALVAMRYAMLTAWRAQVLRFVVCQAISSLPPHILRIFDPKMLEDGRSLKNSMLMLAVWWKNNVSVHRPAAKYGTRRSLRLGLVRRDNCGNEDDNVLLFAYICRGLGVKVRTVWSLSIISASTARANRENVPAKGTDPIPRNWIEFYSPMDQKWVCLDCTRGLMDDKSRLESRDCSHAFVLGCDENGHVSDLTAKYATDFAGKSFRLRKDEDNWLKNALCWFNRLLRHGPHSLLPDLEASAENAEADDEALEIPKTLAAVKSHPKLMLLSQLRKYEVLYPEREPIGFFKGDPVHLRSSVQKVRSREAWFSQLARVVKPDETPIKQVKLPKKVGASENDPPALQPLFGEWQTVRYEAPELIDGKIPRNEHGNVDVFQSSMLPKQCVHTTVPYAWKIAKHLRIDYAEACVGFTFHGGRAMPNIYGIVIKESDFGTFQTSYKEVFMQSVQEDAKDLERQIAQKWVKIIKNALIARRLKQDSSVDKQQEAMASRTTSRGHPPSTKDVEVSAVCISALAGDTQSIGQPEEIDEFDKI